MKNMEMTITTQEAIVLMKAIGLANMHPDMDKTDRMVATWVAERVQRLSNDGLHAWMEKVEDGFGLAAV